MIPTADPKANTKLDRLLSDLDQIGWKSGLTDDSLGGLCEVSLRGDSYVLAAIAGEIACDLQPITLRGLLYRVVSTSFFPSTDDRYYKKLGNLMSTLRRSGSNSLRWIVDNIRSTIKSSSWSGLQDFTETVRDAYRKDFWSSLPVYVHIFVEKDAMTGVIEPVTRELDVALSPVRGYVSDSYAHEIGKSFREIDKPIKCFYIGDFDPSGFDLERSLRERSRNIQGSRCSMPVNFRSRSLMVSTESMPKPVDHSSHGNGSHWSRTSFDEHDLYELPVKKTDSRSKAFIEEYGERCAEVDALPPNIIRDRVREAIMRYIPQTEWDRLKEVERIERESWESTIGSLMSKTGRDGR